MTTLTEIAPKTYYGGDLCMDADVEPVVDDALWIEDITELTRRALEATAPRELPSEPPIRGVRDYLDRNREAHDASLERVNKFGMGWFAALALIAYPFSPHGGSDKVG